MKKVILNGKNIADKASLHETLISLLDLPEWYGKNLDALHDCLTSIKDETEIQIINKDALEEAIGKYTFSLMKVLKESAEENPNLKII
ncbi:MAG: barstar family protein [Firmicutes bacterium]|nr:barstar family protein [Bacillota bacterium]